jgi:hypothetical protein
MLKGHLDMIVLAALSAGPAHGHAVIEESSVGAAKNSICRRERSTPRCIASRKRACSPAAG